MVSLALVTTRIAEILEVKALGCDSLNNRGGIGTNAHSTKNSRTYLHTILLLDLRTHLLCRVTSHSVGYLMSEYDSQRSLVLRKWQDTFIHTDQAARHTPGISFFVLHQVEGPFKVLHISRHTISVQIVNNCGSQVLPYPFHHSCIGGVGRELGCFHKLLILLSGETEHIAIAHHQTLLAPSDGHRFRCAAADHQNGNK